MRIKIILFSVLFALSFSVAAVQAQTSDEGEKSFKILFSSFDSSSAGKYQYLADSVQAMLVSRLATLEQVEVIDKIFSAKELSRLRNNTKVGAPVLGGLEADYLITGSLYALNSGLDIRVVLYPMQPEKKVLSFSKISNTSSSLISDMEDLVWDISGGAFGESSEGVDKKSSSGTSLGEKGFITEHPEAAYKKKLYSGTIAEIQGSGLTVATSGAKKSLTIPHELTRIAVGDVDNDGQNEVLVLANTTLLLYKVNEQGIERIDKTVLPRTLRIHAMNFADINEDGELEIYLSATNRLEVSSLILRWNRKAGFEKLADNIPWYLRPMKTPDDGWRLIGQKKGIDRAEFIKPGLFQLRLTEDYKVAEEKRLAVPSEINLFDFVFADLDGGGSSYIVAVDQKERLKVYGTGNQLLWVSQRYFGGSTIYLGPSHGDSKARSGQFSLGFDEVEEQEPVFVPTNILVTDIDGDGKEDVIVNENKSGTLGFFYKLRIYKSGTITGLSWNGETMTETWRTGSFRGAVRDYSFSVLKEADGQTNVAEDKKEKSTGRLFVASIPAKGSLAELLPKRLHSELQVYDIEFSQQN